MTRTPDGVRTRYGTDRSGWTMPVLAAAGLAVVVVTSLVAAGGTAPGWEQAVFGAVNGLPGWLERPMWTVQLLGVLGTPLAAALVAAGLRRFRLAIGLALTAPGKLLLEMHVLKALVERQRPGRTEPGAILRDVPGAGLSFPSGHAIVAVAMATLLLPYLRRGWQLAAFGLAAGVCVARVYLGAHNPLDVVCGAGAGLVLGAVLTLVLGVRRALPAAA
jgi:membrane-associated phospholipid phosphatase